MHVSAQELAVLDKAVKLGRRDKPVVSVGISLAIIRGLDVTFAGCALLFMLPVMLALAIMTWLGDPGPIFFGHTRVGKNGRSFHCFKFRTMVINAEERLIQLLQSDTIARAEWERDRKLANDPRITRIGRFMRRSSLDELPQLWNVICGDMSLIGPRPIVQAEVPRYGRYIADYMSTRPGISGLWQISGRNDVSYRRRVALDVAFARSQSLKLYLRILVLTLPAVLFQRGSY
jgi:exopolysaccharide production protein ExoY